MWGHLRWTFVWLDLLKNFFALLLLALLFDLAFDFGKLLRHLCQSGLPGRGAFAYIAHVTLGRLRLVPVRTEAAVPVAFLDDDSRTLGISFIFKDRIWNGNWVINWIRKKLLPSAFCRLQVLTTRSCARLFHLCLINENEYFVSKHLKVKSNNLTVDGGVRAYITNPINLSNSVGFF